MKTQDPVNTPMLAGWAIAFGMALVAFGVSYLILDLGVMGAALIAAVIFFVVGFILGMPKGSSAPARAATAPAPEPAPEPAPVNEAAPAAVESPVAPVAAAAAEPAPAAAPSFEASRPQGLDAARGGVADDLKLIKGVGPALEKLCNKLGYYHFDQIAAWTDAEVAWVDNNLEGFKGRVTRDGWVAQAKILATGGETEFSKRQ